MQFGKIEENVETDTHNNPVSIIRMDDGMTYRLVQFPSREDNVIRKAVYAIGGKYVSVSISSFNKDEAGERIRITAVRVGPFEITWQKGQVRDYLTPHQFPKAAKGSVVNMPEDITRFILMAVHYVAVLGLWKDKSHENKTGK